MPSWFAEYLWPAPLTTCRVAGGGPPRRGGCCGGADCRTDADVDGETWSSSASALSQLAVDMRLSQLAVDMRDSASLFRAFSCSSAALRTQFRSSLSSRIRTSSVLLLIISACR